MLFAEWTSVINYASVINWIGFTEYDSFNIWTILTEWIGFNESTAGMQWMIVTELLDVRASPSSGGLRQGMLIPWLKWLVN